MTRLRSMLSFVDLTLMWTNPTQVLTRQDIGPTKAATSKIHEKKPCWKKWLAQGLVPPSRTRLFWYETTTRTQNEPKCSSPEALEEGAGT